MPHDDAIRFTDILTNASTIAALQNAPLVTFLHLAQAVEVLTGARSMEEYGPGVSPLVRAGRQEIDVDPAVQAFAQEWFARLGGDVMATLGPDACEQFAADARHRADSAGSA